MTSQQTVHQHAGIKRRSPSSCSNDDVDTSRRNKLAVCNSNPIICNISPVTKKTKKNKKSIRFSSTCDITFVEKFDQDKIDASELWYTDEDHRAMRQSNARAAKTLYLYLSSPNSSMQSNSKIDDAKLFDLMTGIEGLILSKEVKATKEAHLNAVLGEQERQDDVGMWDEERIALASKQYSRFSLRRAMNIGAQQSSI